MIMIMVMIIFPILAITDWLWQIGISSSPKLHLDVPKSRLRLIFVFWFQQQTVSKLRRRRYPILISVILEDTYDLSTFFWARKEFDIETKMGGEVKRTLISSLFSISLTIYLILTIVLKIHYLSPSYLNKFLFTIYKIYISL